VWHDSFISVTWLIHVCSMTHSYVWHDSFMCVAWPMHISVCTNPRGPLIFNVCLCVFICMYVCVCVLVCKQDPHSLLIFSGGASRTSAGPRTEGTCATWLIDMCDMTHWYVWNMTHWYAWHDSFMSGGASRISAGPRAEGTRATWLHSCVWLDWFTCEGARCLTWLINVCDMIHWYAWHDTFLSGGASRTSAGPRTEYMCDMTHWYVWHDSLICVTWLIHMWEGIRVRNVGCVTWPIYMWDMTH